MSLNRVAQPHAPFGCKLLWPICYLIKILCSCLLTTKNLKHIRRICNHQMSTHAKRSIRHQVSSMAKFQSWSIARLVWTHHFKHCKHYRGPSSSHVQRSLSSPRLTGPAPTSPALIRAGPSRTPPQPAPARAGCRVPGAGRLSVARCRRNMIL